MDLNELTVSNNYKLIVTIVKKGAASKIVAATKKAGAEGGTILFGKGTANKNIYLDFLGMDFEPEKEVILTFVKQEIAEDILAVITREANLNKPGKGIGFVIDIKRLTGIMHLLKLVKDDK